MDLMDLDVLQDGRQFTPIALRPGEDMAFMSCLNEVSSQAGADKSGSTR